MNKKKVTIILMVFIAIFSTIMLIVNRDNVEITNEVNNKSRKNNNLLTMNLEQTAGAGDYKTVTQSGWPTEGYKFNSELSKCENGSEISWDDTKKAVIMQGNVSDKCYVYFDLIPPITLVEYITSLYTGTQGENGIYYHDSSLANGAGDNSYRYAGASDSVNNYICLDFDKEIGYSLANLFRIIGVFGDQVKVIRVNSIGTIGWDTNGSNTWSTSSLNTYLNGEYLTSLGTIAEKITTTTWKVGGNTYANIRDVVPATTYQNEIVNPDPTNSTDNATTYSAKIGLMYASDYGFAAEPSAWTLSMENYDDSIATSTNWLASGPVKWTITRVSNSSNYAIAVASGMNFGSMTMTFSVYPVFNLSSSITYVSGSGSMNDPIIIK